MTHFIYFIAMLVFIAGFVMLSTSDNYFKKIIGLCLFQNSVLIFYIALGKVSNGAIPLYDINKSNVVYSAPLNHVLMLTAIVVGFSTLSVALALLYRINQKFNSLSEKDIEIIMQSE